MTAKREEQGFVLIICLIFLAIMTLIATTMFRGFTLDERNAGNNREKDRALDAAQLPLDLAKFWLGKSGNAWITGTWNQGIDCSTTPATVNPFPVVCKTGTVFAPLADPTDLSAWGSYSTYVPTPSIPPVTLMDISSTGGLTDATHNFYASQLKYSIEYLGTTSANPPTAMYKVVSGALGGNDSAVAVVQAVYNVETLSKDIGGG